MPSPNGYFSDHSVKMGKFVEAIMKQTKMKTTKPGLGHFSTTLWVHECVLSPRCTQSHRHTHTHKLLEEEFLRSV